MKKFLSAIYGLCLIVVTVVFTVHFWALNPSFYTRQYEQMHLAQQLGVSETDLDRSIVTLLDYLQDKRSDIQVEITKDNQKQEAFNQRETDHMVDVKALYQNAMRVGFIALALALILIIYIGRQKNGWAFLTKGVLEASAAFLVFIGFLAIWMAMDFTDFWTRFHHLFFSNDLWLLTPGVDFMIDMLPEAVFNRLVVSIVGTVVVILLGINAGCLYYQRKKAPIGYEVER